MFKENSSLLFVLNCVQVDDGFLEVKQLMSDLVESLHVV
jgi:hypothetical protein